MKISIVTPSYNLGKYISQTIDSVISQSGDFDLEYFIVDGGSSDDTLKILEKYKQNIDSNNVKINCNTLRFEYISQNDDGMYDALNKGFAMCSGDICAWINADDVYSPNSFNKVIQIFQDIPSLDWLKGVTSYIDSSTNRIKEGRMNIYNRKLLEYGLYREFSWYVQQDSVFFRKSLLDNVGLFDIKYKSAGDYWLWTQMARYTKLISVDIPFSCFRILDNQKSSDTAKYLTECNNILQECGKLYLYNIFRPYVNILARLEKKGIITPKLLWRLTNIFGYEYVVYDKGSSKYILKGIY